MREICDLSVLEVGSSRSRCWQGHVASKGTGEVSVQTSLLASRQSLGLWQHNTYLYLKFSLGACLCPDFLCLKGIQSPWIRGSCHFIVITSQLSPCATTTFLNKVTFWGPEGQDFKSRYLSESYLERENAIISKEAEIVSTCQARGMFGHFVFLAQRTFTFLSVLRHDYFVNLLLSWSIVVTDGLDWCWCSVFNIILMSSFNGKRQNLALSASKTKT